MDNSKQHLRTHSYSIHTISN